MPAPAPARHALPVGARVSGGAWGFALDWVASNRDLLAQGRSADAAINSLAALIERAQANEREGYQAMPEEILAQRRRIDELENMAREIAYGNMEARDASEHALAALGQG